MLNLLKPPMLQYSSLFASCHGMLRLLSPCILLVLVGSADAAFVSVRPTGNAFEFDVFVTMEGATRVKAIDVGILAVGGTFESVSSAGSVFEGELFGPAHTIVGSPQDAGGVAFLTASSLEFGVGPFQTGDEFLLGTVVARDFEWLQIDPDTLYEIAGERSQKVQRDPTDPITGEATVLLWPLDGSIEPQSLVGKPEPPPPPPPPPDNAVVVVRTFGVTGEFKVEIRVHFNETDFIHSVDFGLEVEGGEILSVSEPGASDFADGSHTIHPDGSIVFSAKSLGGLKVEGGDRLSIATLVVTTGSVITLSGDLPMELTRASGSLPLLDGVGRVVASVIRPGCASCFGPADSIEDGASIPEPRVFCLLGLVLAAFATRTLLPQQV